MPDLFYLDHAATSPIRPEARAAMNVALSETMGNPSALHAPGVAAASLIERAAGQVASVVGCRAADLVWTSGATEATNLALQGVAGFLRRGRATDGPVRIVSCVTEHAATRDTLRALEAAGQVTVDWLPVDSEGGLDMQALTAALARGVDLASFMQVNNETGVIHDIPEIAARCEVAGVPLHVDAAQSLGRLSIDLASMPVALMSLSAHKIGGPPGIGALYVRRRPRVGLSPQIIGGGQQNGLRAGTLPTHQIAGFGAATFAANEERETVQARLAVCRDRLWQRLSTIDGVYRNGPADRRTAAPFVNISVAGVHGEALRAGLAYGEPAVSVSGGSACRAARGESSHVLRAMGRAPRLASASLRFSLGSDIDTAGVDRVAARVASEIQRLRTVAAAV